MHTKAFYWYSKFPQTCFQRLPHTHRSCWYSSSHITRGGLRRALLLCCGHLGLWSNPIQTICQILPFLEWRIKKGKYEVREREGEREVKQLHIHVLYCPKNKPLPSLTHKFLHRHFASFIAPHPYHLEGAGHETSGLRATVTSINYRDGSAKKYTTRFVGIACHIHYTSLHLVF